ncbi:MAG TPA: COX15/CtaA family protein [Acidimicrobiales bacterium]|nr:COX15/CtaA family protein [Acidimicrobiales bacterium]
MQRFERLSVSGSVVRKIALATVVLYALLVLSGGAVRLSGSGLGCPDWPSCYQHRLVAALSFHPLVEDLNRFFTVGVSIVSVVAFLAALLRAPRRRDITWPAFGLLLGLLAQIVLGGLVVLFKLNPYLVALHFLLTLVVLADAIWMYHRTGVPDEAADGTPQQVVARELRWLVAALLACLAVVTMAGTIVTGSGPHSGSTGTERIPIAFRDAAELHSSLAWLLLGLVTASLFAFRVARAPELVQRRARTMFELTILQGALGYTQYFLHDAAAIVELHLAGVTCLWIAASGLLLSLHEHVVPERTPAQKPTGADAAATPATTIAAVGTERPAAEPAPLR